MWLMLPQGNEVALPSTAGGWAADDLPHQILLGSFVNVTPVASPPKCGIEAGV